MNLPQSVTDHPPVWSVVAQIGTDRFTGRVAVGAAPRVSVWALDGVVYLVERDDDAAVQTRLVTSGLVSPEQLAHGVMLVDGRVSLARLFQRVPDLDRNGVLQALRRANDSTLSAIADLSADPVERTPALLHPADIAEWGIAVASAAPAPLTILPPTPTIAAVPTLPTLAGTPRPVATGRVEPTAALDDDIASRIWRMVDAQQLTLRAEEPS